MSQQPRLRESAVRPPPTADGDPRLGHLVARADPAAARISLLGFPCDQGVVRNGGRPGAAEGPRALREQLYRLTPDAGCPAHAALLSATLDLGDLELTGALERDQELLGAVVARELGNGRRVVILGGGHETSYGHFLGYLGATPAGPPISILNFDAHPDVREPTAAGGHSGSPFRQALEHSSRLVRGYQVAGLLPWSVAASHLGYLEAAGAGFVFRAELDAERAVALVGALAGAQPGAGFVSFDLDVVDAAAAPGVSAPGVGGVPAAVVFAAALAAGRHKAVRSIDVVELNPAFDRDGCTARIAALIVWHYLRGLADGAPVGAADARAAR